MHTYTIKPEFINRIKNDWNIINGLATINGNSPFTIVQNWIYKSKHEEFTKLQNLEYLVECFNLSDIYEMVDKKTIEKKSLPNKARQGVEL
jgi:hypothetical protein